METEVEILSGLSEGDQVVIAGQLKIRRPGQPPRCCPRHLHRGLRPLRRGRPRCESISARQQPMRISEIWH